MKLKKLSTLFITVLLIALTACNGKSSGHQYDESEFLNDNSNNAYSSQLVGNNGHRETNNHQNNNENNHDNNNANVNINNDGDSKKQICGIFKKNYTKIINGVACESTGSPVMKIITSTNSGKYLCSGTLIDSDVILTAGHCFNEIPANEEISKITVISGKKELEVKDVYVQDDYSPLNGIDLAIILLKKKVSNIAPVPLIVSKNIKKGATLMTYGYGVTEREYYGSLRATYMKIHEQDSKWISAAYDDTKTNVCDGDSGGPAIMMVNGIAGIVGVASFGTNSDCKSGDITYFPKVSIQTNLNFIKRFASVSTL